MVAAYLGHTAIVELLLGRDDTNPNAECNEHLTSIMTAARSGHTEVVQLLLKRGVRTDVRNPTDWTALAYAASGRHVQVVQLLLEHGVSVESRDFALQVVSGLVREPTPQEVVIQLLHDYRA